MSSSRKERQQIAEITDLTGELLEKRYTAVNAKKLRGVHPKSHGCVTASFTVNNNIAEELKVGLFAYTGQTFSCLIRFSNATALVQDDIADGKHASRGMAIKIKTENLRDQTLLNPDGSRTQDFLLINSPSFAFSNVSDYLRLTRIIAEDKDDIGRFFQPLVRPEGFSSAEIASTKKTAGIIQQIISTPVADPLSIRYFGAAPFKFGNDHIMRFAVVPSGGELPQQVPSNPSPNYLKDALNNRLNKSVPISFDFMVQVRRKTEDKLMLEDATSHWPESSFPFMKIAKLNIQTPQADVNSPANEAKCEKLRFSPFHTLTAHEPLGGINRLRKSVYEKSASSRLSEQLISRFSSR